MRDSRVVMRCEDDVEECVWKVEVTDVTKLWGIPSRQVLHVNRKSCVCYFKNKPLNCKPPYLVVVPEASRDER